MKLRDSVMDTLDMDKPMWNSGEYLGQKYQLGVHQHVDGLSIHETG